MSTNEAGMVPLRVMYPIEVKDLGNSIADMFKLMELIYVKGHCNLDQTQTKLLVDMAMDVDVDFTLLDDAIVDNARNRTIQALAEETELWALRYAYSRVQEAVLKIKQGEINQQWLTQIWEELWELYDGIYPEPDATPEKERLVTKLRKREQFPFPLSSMG